MGFTKHENKNVYEKILVVKNINKSKASLKKVWKVQIKFSWVRLSNRVFGFNFMLFEINFVFMFFDINFVFMLFALTLFGT